MGVYNYGMQQYWSRRSGKVFLRHEAWIGTTELKWRVLLMVGTIFQTRKTWAKVLRQRPDASRKEIINQRVKTTTSKQTYFVFTAQYFDVFSFLLAISQHLNARRQHRKLCTSFKRTIRRRGNIRATSLHAQISWIVPISLRWVIVSPPCHSLHIYCTFILWTYLPRQLHW